MVFLIRLYQFAVRPFLAGSCKFVPTCSEYGIEALHRHGWRRGLVLAVRRIARCHPLGRGGIDPVPDSLRGGFRTAVGWLAIATIGTAVLVFLTSLF